jgi:NAD(P)-dependent dehydrogenase (short-subunit alcohol dehydrogenase family)
MTTSANLPTALVTGASRGFGRAVAGELAARGWHVVIDARDARALAAAAAALPAGRVTAVPGDVTDPAHRARLARALDGRGRLDLLVNNAGALGVTPLPRLAEHPLDDLAALYSVNVLAPLALIQMVLRLLRRQGGAVVNVTSDAAVEAYEGWGGYGSSKAALEHLGAVLAAEDPGVRVWSLDPGEMATAMLRAAGEDPAAAAPPEAVAPAVPALLDRRPPSGRLRAADLLAAAVR